MSYPANESLNDLVPRTTDHVLARIAQVQPLTVPFRHCSISSILPDDVYAGLDAYRHEILSSKVLQQRSQDSKSFINRRFRLHGSDNHWAKAMFTVFSSAVVKRALFQLFYTNLTTELLNRTEIHREFEFTFCRPGLFQDIHIDIPPKLLSMVFYFPEGPVSDAESVDNATILYDRQLRPAGSARFLPNSVCLFAPHFYSYHGFATTIDRHAIVMFYLDKTILRYWRLMDRLSPVIRLDRPPFRLIRKFVSWKLRTFRQIEYEIGGIEKIAAEYEQCLVNAPQGRVIIPSSTSR